ncbi:HAD-IC family P-type ATPase, partial [Candidatus Woesearchaeota archaeon]|nr:HAD-IC family P-type ATPase [Candidatus Woesearchaeota archaeon]
MADFYNLNPENSMKRLSSSLNGLSTKEAHKRLEKYGPNKLKSGKKISKWNIFISQFKSFIVLILIAATLISFLMGEVIDASVIFLIVILNAVFGFMQEYNAEKSIEALKKLTSLKSIIIRHGKEMEIDSSNIVPGDILLLEEGSKIPADGRILECNNFSTKESSLTGESVPVHKNNGLINGEKNLADRKNMVFSSTIVTRGNAKVLVTSTGMNTEVGKIAKLIENTSEDKTPLQKGLDKLGKKLGILTILICIVIFLIKFYDLSKAHDLMFALNEAFMISIALAVAAIPEGLPAVVTISLALGVKSMVKQNALIRHMTSVETLGSTNIICSDKTGT